MNDVIEIIARPRETISWKKFLKETPPCSIALDGYVHGPPTHDFSTKHFNFDHHHGVISTATNSTSMQVFMAIKEGLFETLRENGKPKAYVYVNDSDQDVCLSCWELANYKMLDGVKSLPHFNRLLDITNKLDITAGSFPMDLNEQLVREHNWIFSPYSEFRKSGALTHATPEVLKDNIETVMGRIMEFILGQGGEKPLDTRHEVLYESPWGYKIIHEIGGNDARYYLFAHGLEAYISLVATRPDGRHVYSIGRKWFFPFLPCEELYPLYNQAEGLDPKCGWGGTEFRGGSSRKFGSRLIAVNEQKGAAPDLRTLTDEYLEKRFGQP